MLSRTQFIFVIAKDIWWPPEHYYICHECMYVFFLLDEGNCYPPAHQKEYFWTCHLLCCFFFYPLCSDNIFLSLYPTSLYEFSQFFLVWTMSYMLGFMGSKDKPMCTWTENAWLYINCSVLSCGPYFYKEIWYIWNLRNLSEQGYFCVWRVAKIIFVYSITLAVACLWFKKV